MMGAGEYRAGAGFGGLDPSADPTPRGAMRKATTSRFYDHELRDYTVDTKGRAKEEHSLDTWVKLQMTIAKGSIASDPEHGNPVAEIEHLGADTASRVENKLRALVSPKVRSGELEVRRINVSTSGNRIGIVFEYFNVTLGLSRTAAV